MNDTEDRVAQVWAVVVGVTLIGVGLLTFVPDQQVVSDDPDALLHSDAVHAAVHLVTGALALYIAFGPRGRQRGDWLIGFGVLYGAIFVTLLVSPDMFGLLMMPTNLPLHVIHALLTLGSLGLGYLARQSAAAPGQVSHRRAS